MPDYSKNFLTSMTGYLDFNDPDGDPEPDPVKRKSFKTGDFEFESTLKRVPISSLRNKNKSDFEFDSSIKEVPVSQLRGKDAPTNFKTDDFEFESSISETDKGAVGKNTPASFNTGDLEFKSSINEIPKNKVGKNTPTDFNTGDFEFKSSIKESDNGGGGKIPLPDYKNPESRLNYAKEFTKKYGPLMAQRGDTPLRINEKPAWGTDTSLNLSKKSASQFGIDPALFYASSMEEGMSGLYPHKIKGREKEGDLVNSSGNKDYPVSGLWSFGLDSFPQKYESLVKKGYLPKDFDKNFIVGEDAGSGDEQEGGSALFKNTDAAVQASAAMLKTYYDDIDQYVSKKKIPLSKKDRDFFALAAFNAGEGVGRQMLSEYYENGHLKDGAYLKKRPTSGKGLKESSYKQVYENVIRRIQMADAIKKEGLFN